MKKRLLVCLTALLVATQGVNASAYTIQEDNYKQLEKEYEIGEKQGHWDNTTRDTKYVVYKVQRTGEHQYYKTLEGLEKSAKLRNALKDALGIALFLPETIQEDGNHDGTAVTMSTILARNYFNLSRVCLKTPFLCTI